MAYGTVLHTKLEPKQMPADDQVQEKVVREERWRALRDLEDWLEAPMLLLGLAWLLLLILELVRGGSPLFDILGTAIWVVFLIDFLVRFILAPSKGSYLRRNTLTAVSLLLPAMRVFRLTRALRVLRLGRTARGLRLVRLVTSFRRGMSALGTTMRRRGLGYVISLTLLVTFLGAAGVYAFENSAPGAPGFTSYLEALWWTAMLLTSIGSEYGPRSGEARLLTLLLSIYGFAVFGYLTAALASFFVGRDVARERSDAAEAEIGELKEEVRTLRQRPAAPDDPPSG